MKLLVLFGGSSFEHEISIVSAATLKEKIKKHSLEFIFVDKEREFYLIDPKQMKSTYFSSGEYQKSTKLSLIKGGFEFKKLFSKEVLKGDYLINLIHGRDGEDGKIASLLRFFSINALTPSIEASVISYNKLYTKMYAKERGVEVLPYEVISSPKERSIAFPVILKPLHLGSSIGLSVASNEEEFLYAFDVASEFDTEVLIEPFIDSIHEYNLAGYKSDTLNFSHVEKVQKKELLDFEKKYLDFSRKETQKESVDKSIETEIKEAFKKIFPLFEGALIRCDFFEKEGVIYLNEINPIPGSLANYLFDDFDTVLEEIYKGLTKEKKIDITYAYIDKIRQSKGK